MFDAPPAERVGRHVNRLRSSTYLSVKLQQIKTDPQAPAFASSPIRVASNRSRQPGIANWFYDFIMPQVFPSAKSDARGFKIRHFDERTRLSLTPNEAKIQHGLTHQLRSTSFV